MMGNYAEHFTSHLRLSILQILAEATAYSLNDTIIAMAAGSLGLSTSRDRVRTELVWLEEQGLLELGHIANDALVATLLGRGLDVAAGLAVCPGVQRPAPKG